MIRVTACTTMIVILITVSIASHQKNINNIITQTAMILLLLLRNDAEIMVGIIVERIVHGSGTITTSSTTKITKTEIWTIRVIISTRETTMDINIITNSILIKATIIIIILRLITQTSDLDLEITQIQINTRTVVEIWAVVPMVSDNNLTMVETDTTFTRREGDLSVCVCIFFFAWYKTTFMI